MVDFIDLRCWKSEKTGEVVSNLSGYKRWGLLILKWTLLAAFGFFAVLIVERIR